MNYKTIMKGAILLEDRAIKLGIYIKEKRKKKFPKLDNFTEATGINKGTLSKLENGKLAKNVSPFLLKDIAKALNIDYKDLYKIAGYLEEVEIKEVTVKGNAIKLDHKIIELPVYGRASAGPGYINLENQISTKRVIANGFSADSFIVEVTGDSMSYEINDGDWAVVDPQQRDYIENKVYVVTYEEETFIKQIVCPAKGMVVLKSFNGKYEDKYVMKDSLSRLKVEGRVVKVISEKRF